MSESDERTALCALNRIFGYRPALGHRLVREAGSAAAVFSLKDFSLPESPALAAEIRPDAIRWAEKELQRIRDGGFRFIGFGEREYPPLLKECPDPPLGLYINGSTDPSEVFGARKAVAVVGTRDVSGYGREWCRKIVRAFAEVPTPPSVVSGLAFGTDGTAHAEALEAGIPTIGVMATGIGQVYPWRHTSLAVRMVQTPGCALVTDYPLDTAPIAVNFMRRNRIIAGLCTATIVIESRTKGGSLITARYACDYNRDVYALPGRVDDVRSQGCNSLIRTKMADIITSPEALLDQLGLGPIRSQGKEDFLSLMERRYGPGSEEARTALLVREHRGATFDELSQLEGRSWGDIARTAAILESDGVLQTDLLQRCFINGNFV